jgi:hypothetical protein
MKRLSGRCKQPTAVAFTSNDAWLSVADIQLKVHYVLCIAHEFLGQNTQQNGMMGSAALLLLHSHTCMVNS